MVPKRAQLGRQLLALVGDRVLKVIFGERTQSQQARVAMPACLARKRWVIAGARE